MTTAKVGGRAKVMFSELESGLWLRLKLGAELK